MELLDMLKEYAGRAGGEYTVEQILELARRNHILTDAGCFIIFAAVFDEVHILFAYARPGVPIGPLKAQLEERAKAAGCRRILFTTKRGAAFARKYKDYKPVEVVFEKRLKGG